MFVLVFINSKIDLYLFKWHFSIYTFTISPNLGSAHNKTWEGRERKAKKERERRMSASLCFLDPKPTARQNSVLGARHNKNGLCAVASRQDLDSFLGKGLLPHPLRTPTHKTLPCASVIQGFLCLLHSDTIDLPLNRSTQLSCGVTLKNSPHHSILSLFMCHILPCSHLLLYLFFY